MLLEIPVLRDASICIDIEDEGPGFSDEAMERAFEPFWPEIKEEENGKVHLGMGLYLSQLWLKPYRAQIELENRPAEGARVRIIIPIK